MTKRNERNGVNDNNINIGAVPDNLFYFNDEELIHCLI